MAEAARRAGPAGAGLSLRPMPAETAPAGSGRAIRIDPLGKSACPRPVAADEAASLRLLLSVEAELRGAETREALTLVLVNEGCRLVRARQVFAVTLPGPGRAAVDRVSGLARVERDAPMVRWIAGVLAGRGPAPETIDLAAAPDGTGEGRTYPFPHALWMPLKDRAGHAFAGLLFARERAWTETDSALAARLAATGAHAALALDGIGRPRLRVGRRKTMLGLGIGALLILAVPVPMTVLAPAVILAEHPAIVAAPIDGIIEAIAVAPNAAVAKGDVIARYVDTTQRNGLAMAERDVGVAEARLRQFTQGAYGDERARREIGQARAELALKAAERDFARDTFGRTQVLAERAGVAVYADRKEWFGKPVTTGQRILEIADPKAVEVRIDLPVADSIVLEEGAHVRVFLDSDPLRPLDASVALATPVARVTDAGVLAYRLVARIAPGEGVPRLGIHGTAQIFGERVPLAFYLFRKPLSWLRQKAGL